jgi:DNA-directed RNA polymerase sigma subunit (sigma70/sigma32)
LTELELIRAAKNGLMESPEQLSDETELLNDAVRAVSAIPNSKHRCYAEAFLAAFTETDDPTLQNVGTITGKSRERARQVRLLIKKYPSMKRLRERLAA